VSTRALKTFQPFKFLHPIVYGEYPKSIQRTVKDMLPKFTAEEAGVVRGTIDYVGVNQYIVYYVPD
jgi:beta-glucosidase